MHSVLPGQIKALVLGDGMVAGWESLYLYRPEQILFCKAEMGPLERKIKLCMLSQGAARGFSGWGSHLSAHSHPGEVTRRPRTTQADIISLLIHFNSG